MTILPPAVLTTAQLVGGLVASAKNVVDLAKASSDHALKGAVNELYDSVFDVRTRALELDEENRSLKAELARKGEFIGPIEPHGYFFYKDKSDQPLCPKCFQLQVSNPVFLSPVEGTGKLRRCYICNWQHYETDEQPLQPVRMDRPTIGSFRKR
jgi:hypothetical protein